MNLQLASTDQLIEQIDQLNSLAKSVIFISPEDARQLAEQVYSLTKNEIFVTPYHYGIAESQSLLCRYYIQRADYLKAIEFGERAIASCEQCSHHYVWAETCGSIGYACTRLGQYAKGLQFFLQQEQLGIQHGYRNLEAAAYLGCGTIYAFIGDLQQAITLKKASLNIFREISDTRGMLLACNNLSYAYNALGAYDQALRYGLDALSPNGTNEIQHIQGLAYTNIGRAYVEMHSFAEGQLYLEKALANAQARDDSYLHMLAHFESGRLAYIQRNMDQAIVHLQTSLQAATKQDQKLYQYEAHHLLSQVYEHLNEQATALFHFKLFHTIRENVLSLQNQARLGVLKVEHTLAQTRREVERAKQIAQELEQQVQERTADLQASLRREQALSQRLERALSRELELQQLKNQLILTASHEFRTPLAIINLSTGILSDHYDKLTAERRLHHWGRVQEQILYLTDMLQDLFTVNSATEINPHFTPYRLNDFCGQLQSALTKVIQQPHLVHFSFPESAIGISTDFDLVKRILFNLTVNAIKFSDALAPVLISFSYNDQSLLLQVSDQGIGIPAAEIERIFELFYRASNVDTRRGIGLGLSVVQKIIQVLHGNVHAESPGINQGSTFYVALPRLAVQNNVL